MLIDWLTLKICSSRIKPDVLALLRGDANTILCVSPDGEYLWDQYSRVNIKSDTHQLNIAVGGHLVISGSPARFMPDELNLNDNVFGSLDIVYCANLMLNHISKVLNVELPSYKKFTLTRCDITQNYYFKNGAFDINRILSHWKSSDLGKYATSTHGTSIYWQKGNRINSAKAYYKGEQIIKDFRKRFPDQMKDIKEDFCFDYVALQLGLDAICEDESLNDFEILEKTKLIHTNWAKKSELSKRIRLSQHLLRLEAVFGSRYWTEKNKKTGLYLYKLKSWYNYTADDLMKMHFDYFETRLGKGVDVKNIDCLQDEFISSAVSLGYPVSTGKNAYKTFTLVKQLGKFQVYSKNNPNNLIAQSTFYKHRKIALNAGLTFADFESGTIVPFKIERLDFIEVNSWEDIEALAS